MVFTESMASCTVFLPVLPTSDMVSVPSLFTVALPPSTFLTLVLVSNNWPPLMASVEPAPTVPAATLMILLPPLSRPLPLRLTGPLAPPMMVTPLEPTLVLGVPAAPVTAKPLVSSLLLPVVTLPVVPRSMFLARSTVRLVPAWPITTFLSTLAKSTVAPGATLALVVPVLLLTSQPLLAVVFTTLSCSSVAARPFLAKFGPVKVMLARPVMSPLALSSVIGFALP